MQIPPASPPHHGRVVQQSHTHWSGHVCCIIPKSLLKTATVPYDVKVMNATRPHSRVHNHKRTLTSLTWPRADANQRTAIIVRAHQHSVAALSAVHNAAQKSKVRRTQFCFSHPFARSVVAPFRMHWSARDVPRRHWWRELVMKYSIQAGGQDCRGCISALYWGWRAEVLLSKAIQQRHLNGRSYMEEWTCTMINSMQDCTGQCNKAIRVH